MKFEPFSYFNSKCQVLVVGNSESIKELDYSKYDCIVRINLGVQTKPVDVWVNGLIGSHGSLEIPDDVKIMRLNCEHKGRRTNNISNKKLIKNAYFWSFEEFEKMCEIFDYKRPTTGFIAVYWLLTNTSCKITVTGFDFFETLNRYTKEKINNERGGLYKVHNQKKEKQIFEQWVSENKIIFK